MDNPVFLQTYAVQGMHAGPIGPFLAGYVGFLQQRRYAVETIKHSLRAACAFGGWLDRERIDLDQLSEKVLAKYRDPLRRKNVKPLLPAEVTGLPKLLTWLREQRLAPLPAHPNETEQEKWLVRFDHHLASVHGISDSTRSKHIACAARFMGNLFENRAPDWSAVTADGLRQFVTTDVRKHHPEETVWALRAALRFLIAEGSIPANLFEAVVSVRRFRPDGIPCHLTESDVQRVIAVCNDKTALGLRDQTIIMVLARIGLRAGELARLGLDDIDWTDGQLLIRAGKTKRERVLPLPSDVGHCIVRYLKRARPLSAHRSLFIGHRAPFTTLSPFTISWIARYRLKQAGVNPARFGAHVFRHSAATHMVRQGASFKDIADILGHQQLRTTNIYAKLDLPNLLQVALPWPGGER
jgi:site-specific recombinase XerD